jgi:outer membrane protein OmpA-like peptidoglycan-associated protein
MKFRLALAAATCLALPIAAHAQPVTGPYISLEGGTSILNPINFSETFGGSGKLQYKPSYAGIGALGFGFGNGFRLQIDGDYIHNTLAKADFSTGGSLKAVGFSNKYGPMLNVLYDIPVGLPVFPYVGAGGGYQFVSTRLYSGAPLIGQEVATSAVKGTYAFDIIAGASFPIDAVPGLSLTAEYRFMMLPASYHEGFSVLGAPSEGTIKLGQQSSHTFLAGVRYALFPPAPPPQPPMATPPMATPPVPEAKTYLVFFDWDKYNLTPRATQIIAQAASDSHTSSTTTISVSGYTDTSGTPVYNQGLSERRAKAVAAQLVTDGVPASEIAIHAFGETHLLVPTGPGVREPQNRRVEIVLQ